MTAIPLRVLRLLTTELTDPVLRTTEVPAAVLLQEVTGLRHLPVLQSQAATARHHVVAAAVVTEAVAVRLLPDHPTLLAVQEAVADHQEAAARAAEVLQDHLPEVEDVDNCDPLNSK